MATIEELEARADSIHGAERAALLALAEGMRELAVNLPDGSRLAIDFAETARSVDLHCTGPRPGIFGGVTIRQMVEQLYREAVGENTDEED